MTGDSGFGGNRFINPLLTALNNLHWADPEPTGINEDSDSSTDTVIHHPSPLHTDNPFPNPNPVNTARVTRARLAGIMGTSDLPTFEGRWGEDPQEYLDDVEMYVEDRVANDIAAEKKAKKEASTFRKGLQGDAREWYNNLDAEKRQKYDKLKEDFKKRFPLRVLRTDPSLAARVDNFERRAGESLAECVNRATELSFRATDTQLSKLRDRLYKHMCAGGNEQDLRIQERVTDRLYARSKLDNVNEFVEACTFTDVREAIVACAIRPGTDNRFLDELAGTTSSRRVRTTDESLNEIARAFRQMVTGHASSSYAPSPQTPQTGSSEGYAPAVNFQPGSTVIPPRGIASHNVGGTPGHDPTGTGPNRQGRSNSFTRTDTRTGAPSSGPGPDNRQPSGFSRVRCYNCAEFAHLVRECPYEQRPFDQRQKIRECIGTGAPMPSNLSPLVRLDASSTPQPPREVPARAAEVVTRPGANSPIRSMFGHMGWDDDDWDIHKLNEEHLMLPTSTPAMAGETKKRRTGGASRDQTELMDVDSPGEGGEPSRPAAAGQYRPPSPHPGRTGMRPDLESQFRKLDEKLRLRREKKQDQPVNVPIRLYENTPEERMGTAELLRQIEMPPMKFGQFIDVARGFKAEMSRMFQLSTKPEYKRRKVPTRVRSAMADPDQSRPIPARSATLESMGQHDTGSVRTMLANAKFKDVACVDDGETYLGYITADVNGGDVTRVLVDCGSLTELVSGVFAEKVGLNPLRIEGQSLYLRMADDSASPITHYVKFPMVVGGILSIITAYVVSTSHSYDILLGKGWLRRNKALIDFDRDEMTLTGKKGHQHVAYMLPAAPHGDRVSYFPDEDTIEDVLDDESDDGEDDDVELDLLMAEVLQTAREVHGTASSSSKND